MAKGGFGGNQGNMMKRAQKMQQEFMKLQQELEAAKQAILSQLKSTHDSPGAIEGFYATAALSGMPLTPEEYIREVEKATAEDVAWAAKQVKPHTVYFLRGDA